MPELDPTVQAFYDTIRNGLIDKAPPHLAFTPSQIEWIVDVAFIAAQTVAFHPPKVI